MQIFGSIEHLTFYLILRTSFLRENSMYFQAHKIFMANKVWPENAMLQCLHLECVTKVFGLDILLTGQYYNLQWGTALGSYFLMLDNHQCSYIFRKNQYYYSEFLT